MIRIQLPPTGYSRVLLRGLLVVLPAHWARKPVSGTLRSRLSRITGRSGQVRSAATLAPLASADKSRLLWTPPLPAKENEPDLLQWLGGSVSFHEHISSCRLPEREVACRLGSSIIKTASPGPSGAACAAAGSTWHRFESAPRLRLAAIGIRYSSGSSRTPARLEPFQLREGSRACRRDDAIETRSAAVDSSPA